VAGINDRKSCGAEIPNGGEDLVVANEVKVTEGGKLGLTQQKKKKNKKGKKTKKRGKTRAVNTKRQWKN